MKITKKNIKIVRKRKSELTKMRDECDRLISLIVRSRAGWICEKCGADYSDPEKHKSLHHSHIYSRGNMRLRYESLNGLALCYPCHIHWWHRKTVEAVEWAQTYLGEENWNRLQVMRMGTTKANKLFFVAVKELLERDLQKIRSQSFFNATLLKIDQIIEKSDVQPLT